PEIWSDETHSVRRRCAIEGKPPQVCFRHAAEIAEQHVSFVGIIALEVDEETPRWKRRQHFAQARHHADAAPSERKGLAAIGCVAVTDVETAQLSPRAF